MVSQIWTIWHPTSLIRTCPDFRSPLYVLFWLKTALTDGIYCFGQPKLWNRLQHLKHYSFLLLLIVLGRLNWVRGKWNKLDRCINLSFLFCSLSWPDRTWLVESWGWQMNDALEGLSEWWRRSLVSAFSSWKFKKISKWS